MTTDSVPAGGDPRRLLADARDLARRVRVAQRVTWLPLLVLGLVTLGSIPAYRWGRVVSSNCVTEPGGAEACQVRFLDVGIYWLVAMILAYAGIAAAYLRVARARGLGGRVLPYAIVGILLIVLPFGGVWTGLIQLSDGVPTGGELYLYRLCDPPGVIGLALLVLAWLERNRALLLFTLGYLAVVIVPVAWGFGVSWSGNWGFVPSLATTGGLLLLGGLGFWLTQRQRQPR
jgi:hypothetical protein